MQASPIDFSKSTEDDVVSLFGRGLASFVQQAGGTFSSRRVTLRQENTYPSDQDYALNFSSDEGFILHLFGLQFKRWKGDGWHIEPNQAASLRQMGHVVGYCLPRPCLCVPSNALHGFYFVNPSCLPQECSSVGMAKSLGQHSDEHDDNWAHIRLFARSSGKEFDDIIPRLSWGEFFERVEAGATIIKVPGGPSTPPGPGTPPRREDFRRNSGIGLTVTCSGSWGSAWARAQISDHVRHWSHSALSPPASVIAFESFSRSIDLIEIAP